MEIPIDWDKVLEGGEIEIKKEKHLPDPKDRRAMYDYWDSEEYRKENENEIEDELDFWAELYGS